jgi:hypothetical protein
MIIIQNFITFFNYLVNKTFGLTNINYNEYQFIDENNISIDNDINNDDNNDDNNESYCNFNLCYIFRNIFFRK